MPSRLSSLYRRTLRVFGLQPLPRQTGRRAFDAAQVNRLMSDWITAYTSGDAELRGSIRRMIARVRDLAENNDYVKGFLTDLETNVVGAAPFDLRMDVHDMLPGGEKRTDEKANRLIEAAWEEWSMPEHCTPAGDIAWDDVKCLALRHACMDGALIYRHRFGAAARNRFGYAVQLIEIDQLDLDKEENLPDGGTIRFGVEKDRDGRLRALWVYPYHPGDYTYPLAAGARHEAERIPAAEIGILQVKNRISRTLSPPWFAAGTTRLRHLSGYEEAEVIAARVGACQGGWFTRKEGSSGYPTPVPGQDGITMDAEPGVWQTLPDGVEAVPNNPTHPNTAYGDFRKNVLRGIATGLGVSYTTLGNDLEAVNYSSARVGLLDEREVWKKIQLWFSRHFLRPIFRAWLEMALSTGAIALPVSKFQKFDRPVFKMRRWAWIDPLKDIQAAQHAIALRVGSRRQIVDEAGGDIEDVFADNVADEKLAAKLNLSLQPPDPMPESFGDLTAAGGDGDPAAPAKPAAKKANRPVAQNSG
jgi:lambda family phage portal protein